MIPELGHFAMLAAFAVAVIQFVVPFAGTWKRETRWMAVGASAAQAQFALILIAYACLTWAFVERDWSVAYVAANAHSQLPLMYRISAVWGAHEGSMLLWMLMLTGWGAAVSVFSRSLPRDVQAQVLAVLGALCIGFLLFMLLTSNPFERHFRCRKTAAISIRCCRTPGWSCIRRCSTWAMSASRWRSRSPSPRSSADAWMRPGRAGRGRGRHRPGCS